jgi:hypothetical protein
MSKRNYGRTVKGKAVSKVRPKAARSGEHSRRANSKQARVLGTVTPAERRHHRDDHDVYRLAAALGAGIFCRRRWWCTGRIDRYSSCTTKVVSSRSTIAALIWAFPWIAEASRTAP